MKISRMVLAGLFGTKRSARKLQLNKETVRQLSATQADQVLGGTAGTITSMRSCDCGFVSPGTIYPDPEAAWVFPY